jgi:hypothetical protein
MPDVKQTITDFYRVAQERDFSRDFQFRVLSIQPGDGSDVTITEDDLVYAQGGTIPTRTIVNQDVPYMGLNFKCPGAAQYPGTYSITFTCDNQSALRRVFEKWSFDIFDDEFSTGNYFVPRATSTVDLLQLNPQLDAVAHYQLVGAYPTDVGEISYNIQGTGAPVSFPVTLAYHYWRRIRPEKD